MQHKKRIVVLGGGFAGLNFVKNIDKRLFDVVLVDSNNYNSFPPLFYQIASSGLGPDSICFPFRRELMKGKAKRAEFHLGTIEKVDIAGKYVKTQFEEIYYDLLVVAVGTTNNFFGNESLRDTVYTIKSTAQAMRCRDEILDRLERASLCRDPIQRRKMLSFTVVGGGPAGVEIAGALGEMKKYILHRNYPSIPPEDVSLTLLEGTDKLLGSMSQSSQEDASKYLDQLMVDVKLGHTMNSYENNIVTLDDGKQYYSEMLIWTAGVKGVEIPVSVGSFPLGKGGRIKVDKYNRVVGFESDIFALGDISIMTTPDYPHGHPQLAQVAIQQARNLAKNLNAEKFKYDFKYKDKGTMATIGRNRAVADIKSTHLTGIFAWFVWMFIHLISLLGMRNKINVLIDWIWGYFNYGTSLRLLLYPSKYPLKWHWGEK